MSKKCKRCQRKVYSSQDDAFAAALRNSAKYAVPLRAYPCPHGRGWHLTTQPQRTERHVAA